MISDGLPTSSINWPVVLVIEPISKTPRATLRSLIIPEDLEITPVILSLSANTPSWSTILRILGPTCQPEFVETYPVAVATSKDSPW